MMSFFSTLVAQVDHKADKVAVLALGKLTEVPMIHNKDGDGATVSPGDLKVIYYDALEYQGKKTRVFAWIGIPRTASLEGRVPGIVLVHGGGGTAFKEWVKKWTARGYAAISIAVEGQTDQMKPKKPGVKHRKWATHAWPGPKRDGIYGDSKKPLKDQWMYHAVADTILANSLLRSIPEVDAEQVGVMGISWGGIITSTVIGIDHRFAFAIPTYGCGNLAEASNQYGKALEKNDLYKQVWDPMVRIKRVKTPTLWLSWPGDLHFPLDKHAANYRAMPGPYMVSLIPKMKHGHRPGWNKPDSYAFADSVVKDGRPWLRQTAAKIDKDVFTVSVKTYKSLDSAVLVSTSGTGPTGRRKWTVQSAKIEKVGSTWVVTAKLPKGTTAWFVNIKSGALTISSNYEERKLKKPNE